MKNNLFKPEFKIWLKAFFHQLLNVCIRNYLPVYTDNIKYSKDDNGSNN